MHRTGRSEGSPLAYSARRDAAPPGVVQAPDLERQAMNPVLVEVMRGSAVESVHRGALAIVDADGVLVESLGDIDRPVFPRSAVKVLQALPLVASGAADRLALSDEELAIACASHNGEAAHVCTAAAMLAKAGVDVQALECGAHAPKLEADVRALGRSGAAASALHNNCSGKHAGFVCLACALMGGPAGGTSAGLDLRRFVRGYVDPAHPVMREVTAALQAATGCDLARSPVGTDGCSIPTYAIPLRQLALAFARVATGQGLSPEHAQAARRLRSAVAKAPFMVAGTGRFDTLVMERLGERVFCKVGAEAVYCAALPEQGLGIAIKVDDGNTARAAEVVMAELIARRVRLDAAEQAFIDELRRPVLRNWNGVTVGSLRPAPDWRAP
jgi:L-asparaginase II